MDVDSRTAFDRLILLCKESTFLLNLKVLRPCSDVRPRWSLKPAKSSGMLGLYVFG